HGRSDDYLLPAAALREAEGKTAAFIPEPLGATRLQYIQASIERREREIAAQDALKRAATDAQAALQHQVLQHAEAARAAAEREVQRMQAQSLIERRRTLIAFVGGTISVLVLVLWILLSSA